MATSTTTASAIRAQQVSDIEALSPSSFDGVPFREHREHVEFETWLEGNTVSCFRRFQFMDRLEYELSELSGCDTEVLFARFTLLVAYPKDNRFGLDGDADVISIIEEDHLSIDKAIGVLGAENHIAGQQTCTIDSVDREEGEEHWLVSYELSVQFNLSTGYAGGAFAAPTAGTTTASAIRASQAGFIRALSASSHSGVKFQEHQRGGSFEQWAAQAERGSFRRFYIEPGYSYPPPLYTNFSAEQIQTTFEVQVAYPRDRRFGTGTEHDARQVIAEDAAAIIVAIGSIGTGSYAAGHNGTTFEGSTLDENGDGWLLRLQFEVSFSKAPAFAIVGAVEAPEVIPATVNGILGASDPMQALVDAMGYGVKPAYMWGGNEASGATEIGGSGVDLTATAVLQQQTDAHLGDGDFCYFNDNASSMFSASSSLNPGASSFTIAHIFSYSQPLGTRYFINNFQTGPTLGWRCYVLSSGAMSFGISTASGNRVSTVAGHSSNAPWIAILRRDMVGLKMQLHTHIGDGGIANLFNESCTIASPKFALGDSTYTGSNAKGQGWGITALWKDDATAAALSGTHVSALKAYFGW